MSIRNTFILALIISLVVMATGVSFAVHFYATQESEVEFARESAAQLDRIDDLIHLSFRGAEQAVKNLASLSETREAALARKTSATPSRTGDAALEQRLAALPSLVPGVEAAFCGYSDGSFHSSNPGVTPEGYDAETQFWYTGTAWRLADASVTGLAISGASKSLLATMAAKIKDQGGDILGVAGLTVSLAPLTDTLREIHLGNSGSLMLFDDKGRVLFDPKAQENLLRAAAEIDETVLTLSRLPTGAHTISTGPAEFAAISRTFDGNRWKAVLLMDKAELTAPAWRLIRPVILTAAAALLVLALAGIFLACNATRPLYALIRQSKALADGNADALARIPGRGPDIMALQGNIGMLTGRAILLALAEKQHPRKLESDARETFQPDHVAHDIREADSAANRNTAKCMTSITDEALAAVADLNALAGELRGHARGQAETATCARTAAEAQMDDAVTLAGQAAETEKSAEAALARVHKTDKLARDTASALEAAEEAANVLSHCLHTSRAEAGKMAGLATSVRDIAEDINVLGLNLSIELSRAGEDSGKLAPITGDMRTLAGKIMTVAGSMDSAVAAFEQNQAAHSLAVNKNAVAVRLAAGAGSKADSAAAEAAVAAATAVEQIRVLSTALEGLAQPDVISTENAETALRTAEATTGAVDRLEESANAVRVAAARLAALAAEYESASGTEPTPGEDAANPAGPRENQTTYTDSKFILR